ncbi:cathepsin S-like [Parasteatoda tepidariorum]|uniref:cathepsin S-like n=1 Tax=Parasteatoda tepidariorum TaxID=114398 RepID=UPI001C71A108|nr:procathepsin L-like [Parasteatoda tepidariorum]XP_042898351.1 procathepsin L-like [Parasteatoda tepidariorum]XP_042898352.1 procathepsin L-like [Parasteatoda tepidariorum]
MKKHKLSNTKTIVFFLIMFSFSSSELIVIDGTKDHSWNEFKRAYKKNYTREDERVRKPIWEKALAAIMKHNEDHASGVHSFNLGLNDFSDMSDEDFMNMAMGLEDKMECDNKSLLYSPPKNASIPESIDWNKRGYVTKVVNQGRCGACWAFCSTAALEGQHKRMTGKLVKLSEQHLIDCSTVTGNKQCRGGRMCRAYEYAAAVGGVLADKYYPYENKGGKCKFNSKHIGAKIKGYIEIPYGDEHALLMAVALIGPVAVGLDGYRPRFRHYKSGIYEDPGCSNTTLTHALTIVGYGTENGKDYWLVKNSWGPHWGEGGFGKIVRNKNNHCGLASRAVFPVMTEDENGDPVLRGPRAQ